MIFEHCLLLGNFAPLHKGHLELIRTAIQKAKNVSLLLFTSKQESIPIQYRKQWINQSFPDKINIIPVEFEMPHWNDDPTLIQPLFKIVKINFTHLPDVIFSSCNYTKKLAEQLRIIHYDVDIERKLVSLTSQQIRSKPLTHWNVIADAAKPYFVKKIMLFGPQSVGKSTLTEYLAKYFQTSFVQEYGRIYTKFKPDLQVSDYVLIAQGKVNLESEKTKIANKVLFCDTDTIATKVYLDIQFPNEAHTLSDFFSKVISEQIKTYELCILIEPKGEGVEDGCRKYNAFRKQHFEMIKFNLQKYKVRYILLDGNYNQNTLKSIQLTKQILQKY